MSSFSGSSGRINASLAAIFGIAFASSTVAGDWSLDEDGFSVVTLEQESDGYLDTDKIAIGCSDHHLFFERFSPAGTASSSLVRFHDGTELSIEWNELTGPNAVWAYGPLARSIVNRLLSEQMVSFQEDDRVPIVFRYSYAPPIVDCY
jgi:hypothetical protein